jgi:hypothetical protein
MSGRGRFTRQRESARLMPAMPTAAFAAGVIPMPEASRQVSRLAGGSGDSERRPEDHQLRPSHESVVPHSCHSDAGGISAPGHTFAAPRAIVLARNDTTPLPHALKLRRVAIERFTAQRASPATDPLVIDAKWVVSSCWCAISNCPGCRGDACVARAANPNADAPQFRTYLLGTAPAATTIVPVMFG